MARVKKFVAWRRTERPYTRISKFKKKSYIKADANPRVVTFGMGDPKRKFQYCLDLVSKDSMQVRDNALESARQTSNRLLEKNIGPGNFFFRIRVYPHHVLRENPLAAGAGADRFSTGMSHSFGKPVGIAARVRKGQKLMSIRVDKTHIGAAKRALKRAYQKLPCSCTIEIKKNINYWAGSCGFVSSVDGFSVGVSFTSLVSLLL